MRNKAVFGEEDEKWGKTETPSPRHASLFLVLVLAVSAGYVWQVRECLGGAEMGENPSPRCAACIFFHWWDLITNEIFSHND